MINNSALYVNSRRILASVSEVAEKQIIYMINSDAYLEVMVIWAEFFKNEAFFPEELR